MTQSDRNGGKTEREIESKKKMMRENGGDTREHDEHIGKNGTKSNQVLSNSTSLFLTSFPFYRVEIVEKSG